MEAEQVNTVNRLAAAQSQPRVGPAEGGQPKSAPATGPSPAPVQDTVTLSTQARRAVEQGATEGSGNLHREFDVTENNQVILKIRDGNTQKVVKQIPPEELIRLQQAIREIVEDQE